MFSGRGPANLITEVGSDRPQVFEVVEVTPVGRFPASTGGTYLAGPFWRLRPLGDSLAYEQDHVIYTRMSHAPDNS